MVVGRKSLTGEELFFLKKNNFLYDIAEVTSFLFGLENFKVHYMMTYLTLSLVA